MPIGIVTDEELQQELDRLKPAVSTPGGRVTIAPPKGRKTGDVNVPDSLRKLIGEESVINGRDSALALAKDFGISPSSVSAYAKGSTSTTSYNEPKPSLVEHLNKSRARRIKQADKVLSAALGAITQEKLDHTDADKLSGIAKDMSAIIKNLEPQKSNEGGDGKSSPQFVVFAPTFRDERTFESITIQE